MNISIKATKTTLTPAINEYITEKLAFLDKFLKSEDKVRVEVEVDKKHKTGLVFRAEIEIQPHGQFAEARGEDLYAAIDMAAPKIKEQLAKAKDKKISQRREGIRGGKGK
jgi:putative sigma-54 modulation protein